MQVLDDRTENIVTLGINLSILSKICTKAGDDKIRFVLSKPFILSKNQINENKTSVAPKKVIIVGKHMEQKLL